MGDIYAGNEIMSEYSKFMDYLGDYYQITPGWATARTEWWNMLQRVGTGEDVDHCRQDLLSTTPTQPLRPRHKRACLRANQGKLRAPPSNIPAREGHFV